MRHRIRSIVFSLLAGVLALAALGAPGPLPAQATPATYLVDRTDDVMPQLAQAHRVIAACAARCRTPTPTLARPFH